MPGKHVRFASENAFYSPPSTPSPTFTDSSLPSSAGPTTPPQAPYQPLPYMGPVSIHPLLALYLGIPPVHYDMVYSLSVALMPNPQASPSCSSTVALSQSLDEPATKPPSPSLTLVHPHLPWQLHIRPRVCTYVTVRDVFEYLNRFLQVPVTPTEYDMLPSENDRDAVAYAFHARCQRNRGDEAVSREMEKGVKRLDFLRGRTRFAGLSSTKWGPSVWMLNVA